MPMLLNARLISVSDYTNYAWIDRRTPFGNRFRIGPNGNRDMVCNSYEAVIRKPYNKELRNRMRRELKDKDYLVCWCAPERCHGETILQIICEPIEE